MYNWIGLWMNATSMTYLSGIVRDRKEWRKRTAIIRLLHEHTKRRQKKKKELTQLCNLCVLACL